MSLTVVCVKVRPEYDAEYVNKLHRAVERNLSRAHDFFCYTDDPTGIDCRTFVIPHNNWPGWWSKMFMFGPHIVMYGRELGQTLYFDLDTVILGNIDFMADYDGKFASLYDWGDHRRNSVASGIMSFNREGAAEIWGKWTEKAEEWMKVYRGDQDWLNDHGPKPYFFNEAFPNYFASYKYHVLYRGIKAERVIAFHGVPRPHQLDHPPEWMTENWK